MLNRLRYIWLIILMVTAMQSSGQYIIDRVCVGTTSRYRIDGEVNSTYTWHLTDPSGTVTTLPFTADTVFITWNMEPGVYYLSTVQHSQDNCDAPMEIGYILLFGQPLAYAGESGLICETQPDYFLSTAAATNDSARIWTSSGSGIFNNDTLINPVYTPSVADINNGSVILTLTVYGNVSCPVVSDSMILTISRQAIVDAGRDTIICQTSGSVTLSTATAIHYTSIQWSTSGTGSFSDPSAVNPVYIPSPADILAGSLILTLTGNSMAPCTTVSDQMTLLITRQAEAYAGLNDIICETQPSYILAGATADYYARLGWSTSGTGTFNDSTLLNPVYSPSMADIASGTVTLTLTAYGIVPCANASSSMVLTISRQAVVYAGIGDTICETQVPYHLSAATGIHYTGLSWITSGDGSFNNPNALNPLYSPGPNDILSGWVTLTLTGTSTPPCVDDVDSFTLRIVRNLVASAGPDAWSCMDAPYTLNGASAMYYTSLKWSHTGQGTLSSTTAIHPTYTPAPGELGSILFTLQASSNKPCTDSITDQMELFIYPLPTGIISGQSVGCEGDSAEITLVLTGTSPWTVTFGNGLSTTTLSGITVSPYTFNIVAPAGINNYTLLSVIDAYCQAPPANMSGVAIITVNPLPVIDFSDNGACAEDTTYFTVTGNYILATSYWHWTFGDGTYWTCNAPGCGPAAHVFPAPGTYTVTLFVQDTNGCTYTVTHDVNVRPHPVAFFSFSTPDCLGLPVYFTDLCTNPAGQGYLQEWVWDFGDGTPTQTFTFPTSPNISHTYTLPGIYPVTLKVTNSVGCRDFITLNVTVTNSPTALFTYSQNCEDGETHFHDVSTQNGSGPIHERFWDFGDPASGVNNFSTDKNPKHVYADPGFYTVTLVVYNFNGCSDSTQHVIYVSPAPIADFISSAGCVNTPTYFWADSTIIDINAIATYEWQFGDGGTSNSRNTQHTYVAPGNYNVILTITDTVGCHGSINKVITVTIPPVANFSANTDNCIGQPVQFTDLSTSVNGYNTSWTWNFGDGNIQTVVFPGNANVTHAYTQAGTYEVILTITNSEGCSDSESKTIIVSNGQQADFMFSGQCQGSSVQFTDLTAGSATVIITSWSWNFGDPGSGINNNSSLQNPAHLFANPGTYAVQLITWSSSGCIDTISKNIIIKSQPPIDFSTQGSCEDTPIHFVPGTVINVNTIATWFWQFGDGGSSTQTSPYHTYTAAGTFTATLAITDTAGCSSTIGHVINVVDAPVVNFGFTTPGCSQSEVTFTDLTSVPTGYITKWTWNFGDGTTQTFNFPNSGIVTHTYANAGTFNVVLTVKTSDSCSSTASNTITISPKPAAAFIFNGECQGAEVSFQDLSNGNGATITSRLWDFGDPASGSANNSTLANPSHTYVLSGNYTVELIVSTASGCCDTVSQTITITPPPAVNFSSIAGCNGDTTLFNSSSFVNMATTASWLWQFGDGQTSTLPDPIHVYASSGTYTVTLTIINNAGCPATKSATVVVTPGPVAAFSGSSPSCSGSAVVFTDLSVYNSGNITQWHWVFGDGHDTTYSSFAPAISHIYSQAGNFMVKLTVYSQNGCENTYQQITTVGASPAAGFTWLNTCEGSATQFNDQSVATSGINIVSRVWNFGDPTTGVNNTSTLLNPAHTFSTQGTYLVTLTAINAAGCSDTIQHEVVIVPKPGVDFYHDTVTCLGTPLAFHTDTTATNIASVSSYNWNFGDGTATSNLQNPVHSYANQGTYTVTLTITDLSGCSNSMSHPVTIGESPVSMFSYANSCEDAPTQFTDLSTAPNNGNIINWSWNFGVNGTLSDTSYMQNPTYTYTLPGTYTVTLTTTSATGCTDTKSQPVQIFNKPTAAFKYSTTPCSNGSVQFQDSSYSYQGVITSWLWEFEPFQYSSARNPIYQYFAVDSCYNVKLIVTDFRGCTDTTEKSVCVPDQLTASISHQPACFGTATKFSAQLLTPAGDIINSYQWNFGDPASGSANSSTLSSPSHTFSSVGFYTISLTVTDIYGCQTTVVESVQVFALPEASFTWSNNMFSTTVDFTSTSVIAGSATTQYIWNFGDGTTQTLLHPIITTQHVYAQAGNYTATLTVIDQNGCSSSQSQLVICSPVPAASIHIIDTLICQNYSITVANNSTFPGSIDMWIWNWGDGSSPEIDTIYKPTKSHTYLQSGVFAISLKIISMYNGIPIADSTSRIVTVKPTPVANFTSTGSCAGTRVYFYNSTNQNGTAIVLYSWNFGDVTTLNDTSVLRNTSYTYPEAGEFDAQLIVVNNYRCADTITKPVSMYGSPKADFNNSVACLGHPTLFFDHSDPSLAPLVHSGWAIFDGIHMIGNATGSSFTFTFDSLGVYTVLHAVSDSNGCSDSINYKVTVVPSPFSIFNVNDNFENIQGQVQLENGSLGAEEYLWNFGNGETSIIVSPVITYNEDGEYLIQLYAKNDYGCVDSSAIIYKMLYKGLWVPNAMVLKPISGTQLWKPVGINLSYYRAEVYDRWGELLWSSEKLTEKGAPSEGWDGTFKQQVCSEGVYVWKITAIFRDGSIWNNDDVGNHEGLSGGTSGTITLIR